MEIVHIVAFRSFPFSKHDGENTLGTIGISPLRSNDQADALLLLGEFRHVGIGIWRSVSSIATPRRA
jgi:hypothetical protein